MFRRFRHVPTPVDLQLLQFFIFLDLTKHLNNVIIENYAS